MFISYKLSILVVFFSTKASVNFSTVILVRGSAPSTGEDIVIGVPSAYASPKAVILATQRSSENYFFVSCAAYNDSVLFCW